MSGRISWRVATAIGFLAAAFAARNAQAGCGCDKPPPAPAAVRPAVSYAGSPVSIFSSSFVVGSSYLVTFTSGITGASAAVTGQAVNRRDLADGVYKQQVVVPLPSLPLGPASIAVTNPSSNAVVVSAADTSFTVAPAPVVVPPQYGEFHLPSYAAAVGRDGVSYIALDVSAVTEPMIFDARAAGFALRFGYQDVVFYNSQGFLMQRLVQTSDGKSKTTEPVPGMFVLPASSPATESDTLHYSRHEFDTYFLYHQERQPHALDPSDPNWHVDGTRHVDHNHLILAIIGKNNDGTMPAPGSTPKFDLVTTTYSLFSKGLVGTSSVSMSGSASTDSFDPATNLYDWQGDVFTNGKLSMSGSARINGDASAGSFDVTSTNVITGTKALVTSPLTFMQIKVPTTGLTDLGSIKVSGTTLTLMGPGSFQLKDMTVGSNGRLYVDNSAGPVTLYVLGGVSISGGGVIQVADPNPEKLALYIASDKNVSLSGSGSSFYGVLYAPQSTVSISGDGEFFGAFVGNTMKMSSTARVHYYGALQGN